MRHLTFKWLKLGDTDLLLNAENLFHLATLLTFIWKKPLTFHQHQTLKFTFLFTTIPLLPGVSPPQLVGHLTQLKPRCGCSSAIPYTSIDYESTCSFYWCCQSVFNCPHACGGGEELIPKVCTADFIAGLCHWGTQSTQGREAFGLLSLGNRENHTPKVSVALHLCASPSWQCKIASVHLDHPLQNCGAGAGALNLQKQEVFWKLLRWSLAFLCLVTTG